jgi:ketosteroid isomerase-like protein
MKAVLLPAFALLFVLGAACGDDGGGGDDEASADVQAAMEAAVASWNASDVDALLAQFTDAGLLSSFEAPSRAEAAEFLPDFIGDPAIKLGELEVTVDGDTATVEAKQFAFGNLLDPTRISLIKEGDAWLLDAEEDLPNEIPEGTKAVDLKTLEYQFDFDESAITSGDFAFAVENIGGEEHFVDLSRIPADLDIEQALQSEEEPAGIVNIGSTDPIEPGGTTSMVFTEPLAAGRYVLLCFIEAADGQPHALKGMVGEFTIE